MFNLEKVFFRNVKKNRAVFDNFSYVHCSSRLDYFTKKLPSCACRLYASIHTGIVKLGRPTAPTIDTAEVDKIEGRRNFGLLHGLAWGYKGDRDLNLNYVFLPTPV